MKITLTKPLTATHDLPPPLAKALLDAGYAYNAEPGTDLDAVIGEIIDNAVEMAGDYTSPDWLPVLPLLKAAPRLQEACRMVVERWESGDLAEAARACGEAVEAANPA